MNEKTLLFLSTFLWSLASMADCIPAPEIPVSLNQSEVSVQEIEVLNDQLKQFFESVSNYTSCIESQVAALDFEAEGYEERFSEKQRLLDLAEERKLMAVERFNQLIETAVDETPEPSE